MEELFGYFLKLPLVTIYCHANEATKVETTSVKGSLAFFKFNTGGNGPLVWSLVRISFVMKCPFFSFCTKLLGTNLRICRASPSLSYRCLLFSSFITAIGIVVIVINIPFPNRILSDNPIKRIGIRAFSIPSDELMM